jgi:hypothetical protein
MTQELVCITNTRHHLLLLVLRVNWSHKMNASVTTERVNNMVDLMLDGFVIDARF